MSHPSPSTRIPHHLLVDVAEARDDLRRALTGGAASVGELLGASAAVERHTRSLRACLERLGAFVADAALDAHAPGHRPADVALQRLNNPGPAALAPDMVPDPPTQAGLQRPPPAEPDEYADLADATSAPADAGAGTSPTPPADPATDNDATDDDATDDDATVIDPTNDDATVIDPTIFDPTDSDPTDNDPTPEGADATSVAAAQEVFSSGPARQGVKIDASTLDKLRRRMRQQRFAGDVATQRQRDADRAESTAAARELIATLGETPRRPRNKGAIKREIDRLEKAVEKRAAWAHAGRAVNRAATAWVTCRARAAQDGAIARGIGRSTDRLNQLFPILSAHSKTTQPGAVHGLARDHAPQTDSWTTDARAAEKRLRAQIGESPSQSAASPFNEDDALRRLTERVHDGASTDTLMRDVERYVDQGLSPRHTRLVRLMTPFVDDLPTSLSALRRAIEDDIAAALADDAPTPCPIPDDWPWYKVTRGARAVVVGGDSRPERVEALQQAFGFGEVEWIDGASGPSPRMNSLLTKMRNGTVDLVIALRAFSSHALTDAIFGLDDPDCHVVLADTYGVQQVRLAIERYLANTVDA